MQPVHSKPFLLLLPKLQAERYNLLLHLRTEPCNILRRIIVSSIAQVNKFNVRRKSQLLRNFIAQRNQLVIQRIQLPGNLFIQISPCRHRLFPHLAVRTLHRLQKSIKITRFALKFRRSIRRNFTVLLNHLLCLLYQQMDRRNRLIPELNLSFIKRISGVHRISYLRQFRHCRPGILARFFFHKKSAQLLI